MEVNTFIEQLEQDFPELRFRVGKKFAFRPPRTVVFEQKNDTGEWRLRLMHELGHATLGHRTFRTDPERLKMEAEAWGQAERLCRRYQIEFDQEFAEVQLDSYRDWLHRRSKCPQCGLTRYQTAEGGYRCPGCRLTEDL